MEQLNRCTHGRVPLLSPLLTRSRSSCGSSWQRPKHKLGALKVGDSAWGSNFIPPAPSALSSALQDGLQSWLLGDPGASAVPVVLQLPKVTGSSGCGTSALRPRGRPRTPRAGLCCGYRDAGRDQRLGTGAGKGFGSTRCFGGVVLLPRARPALVAISTRAWALLRWPICSASRFLGCLCWLRCLQPRPGGVCTPVTGAPGWRQPRMALPAPGATKQRLGQVLSRDPEQRWLQTPGGSQAVTGKCAAVAIPVPVCISRLHPDTLPKLREGLEMPGAPWQQQQQVPAHVPRAAARQGRRHCLATSPCPWSSRSLSLSAPEL